MDAPTHRTVLPPGPKAKFPGANLLAFRRDPLHFLQRIAEDYGDISCFRVGVRRVFLLNHTDLIRDVLVTQHKNFHKGHGLQRAKTLLGEGLLTSEEEFHRRQRRLAQPAFHRQRMNAYAAVMTDYAARTAERWRDGQTLDIAAEMMRLTLAIVGKTLFDADTENEAADVGAALTSSIAAFSFLLLPYSEILEKLPLPQMRRFHKARARLDALIYRIIEERRQSNADRGDLLSMLLLAQDEETNGGAMTDEQLRDEAMTIFLAGHETTANALVWTWVLLAQNTDVERKLHEELDAVLGAGNQLPRIEDLPALKYTEMVFAEVLRLYPPAWVIGRRALRECEIGGYAVPEDTLVLMSQYVMHRDKRFFPDPLRFDPERWTEEAREARPPFAYFPFGGGVRRCIGEGFAQMEAVLLIAMLARRWRLRLAPDQKIETKAIITLRPKHSISMTLERRCTAS